MTEKYKFNDIIAETLLIPLYMRAKESRRGKKAIIRDDMAESLVKKFDCDYSQFDKAKLSEVGCVVRGWYFDNAVRQFISTHTDVVVVNIGCGLDTRCQRIGGNTIFYELDLPEVMDLRKKLIPETKTDRHITASLLDEEWMDKLKETHPDSNFIFVAEGVLMYFREEQLRQFLSRISAKFGGGELWFDVCGTMMSRHHVKPDSLRKHKAEIRSGISDGQVVEKWEPRLKLIEQSNYMKFFRLRWGLFGIIMGLFPWLCYKFSSLLGYKILPEGRAY